MRSIRRGNSALGLTAAAALWTNAAFALTPENGGMVGGTDVAVNVSLGDQDDPHLDADLVSYVDRSSPTSTIRYFDFATLFDSPIAHSTNDFDLLSDVSGDRISFSRVLADRTAAMLFDASTATLTEIDAHPGTSRFGTSLGGDTFVFVEAISGNGDVFAYDLSTNAPPVQLSASSEIDENPSVSPAGDAAVWVRQSASLGPGILKAIRSAGTWSSATVVSDTADPEENPDTDGTTVAFDSVRAGERDIFFQPLSGGIETQLEIAGSQSNPSVSSVSCRSRAQRPPPARRLTSLCT